MFVFRLCHLDVRDNGIKITIINSKVSKRFILRCKISCFHFAVSVFTVLNIEEEKLNKMNF